MQQLSPPPFAPPPYPHDTTFCFIGDSTVRYFGYAFASLLTNHTFEKKYSYHQDFTIHSAVNALDSSLEFLFFWAPLTTDLTGSPHSLSSCDLIMWNNFIHEISDETELKEAGNWAERFEPQSKRTSEIRGIQELLEGEATNGAPVVLYASNFVRREKQGWLEVVPRFFKNLEATNSMASSGKFIVRSDLHTLALDVDGYAKRKQPSYQPEYDGVHYPTSDLLDMLVAWDEWGCVDEAVRLAAEQRANDKRESRL
ncbi:hypothetical protein TeGR_g8874 [Tetraparma gracilis]|uniref:SGNH hydrolase-type esterase domain-containing protein n=1 Tax=Tetraparma gracilis TaxID=2962635 RepID=A0ABQ6NBD4_9STRA|nr:hypothetical protein TeGR_g8874 [Tetraparma gracilis]